MGYPEGGGLSAGGRARREKLLLQAAHMFEQDIKPVRVARLLRVSTKSAYQWRRRWRAGGPAALTPKSPGGAAGRPGEGELGGVRGALGPGPAAGSLEGGEEGDVGRGGRAGVPAAGQPGSPVLPGPHPPRAQGRAPLDVRSRLR